MGLIVTAVAGASAVAFGAFGAHALRSRLEPAALAIWQTAVLYHLLHAVALLALVLFARATGRAVGLPAALFGAGIVLFSGSLYGLALTGWRWLGPITPIGGLAFLAGWASLLLLARAR
ncbi:MAG TPA: DUF423 domain-containing protein [Kofleriaceae bacterium]|nr:DUF423 domain-containing protein [Kofleriaceae bacterium]